MNITFIRLYPSFLLLLIESVFNPELGTKPIQRALPLRQPTIAFPPGGASDNEPPCQCRRPGFDPWVGKIPWRRK